MRTNPAEFEVQCLVLFCILICFLKFADQNHCRTQTQKRHRKKDTETNPTPQKDHNPFPIISMHQRHNSDFLQKKKKQLVYQLIYIFICDINFQ